MRFTCKLLVCALAATFGAALVHGAEQLYFVSPKAEPNGDGSSARPFQSLVQARDALRTIRRAGTLKPGTTVTVYLAPGEYQLNSTFDLTAEDSGTPQAPVVYRAQKSGTVRIQGGVTLPSSAFGPVTDPAVLSRLAPEARGKVLACDLSTQTSDALIPFKPGFRGAPSGPWLYFNGRPMTLARWPNQDAPGGSWAEFTKAVDTGLPQPDAADPKMRKAHPGSFVFDDPRPGRWNIEEGVWLLGYWTHDWSDEVLQIGAYDRDKKVITLAAPHSYGIAAGTWGASKRRFFAMNLLEELDAPGEWYLDRDRKQLYFYPPTDVQDAVITLGILTEPMVRIRGGKHIKLIELAFEYSHGDGLVLQNTEGIEIAGCRIANLAGSGITVDGRENVIRSCDLYHLGKGGISLNGGDRQSLSPANNLAVNNHIHHYGLFQRTYAPGIGAGGCGQIARNNRIHDAPHNAVLYGGNEHLFEFNEVYRVVMETGDAGAFYTGRDWTSQGNILRNNYIHNLGGGDAAHVNTMGVYLDDCDSGDTIEGNIFFRAGRAIMIGGGRDNTVSGNLVVDCPIGLHLDARGMTWKQWNNPAYPSWHLEAKAKKLNYTQPPWSERYPKLARIMHENPQQPLGNVIRGNVFVDCTKQLCSFDANVKKLLDKLDIAENLAVNSKGANNVVMAGGLQGFRDLAGSPTAPLDLGFKNRAGGDFSLSSNARLLVEQPSFKSIPMDRIGLVVDEYRRQLPAK
jgi:parallel beta-helix repeat protein